MKSAADQRAQVPGLGFKARNNNRPISSEGCNSSLVLVFDDD